MKKNFLLIQHYGLGDVILSLPAIKILKEFYPNAEITLFISGLYYEIADLLPYVDRFLFFKTQSYYSRIIEVIKIRREHNFDTAIIFNPILFGSILAFLLGANERIGYYRDYERTQNLYFLKYLLLTKRIRPYEGDIYEVQRYFEIIKYGLDIKQEFTPSYDYFTFTDVHKNHFIQLKKMYSIPERAFIVAVCSDSSVAQKEWDLERYIQLFEQIYEKYNLFIMFLGTRQDHSFGQKLRFKFGNSAIDLRGKTTLKELIILINYSNFLLTVDNGPYHIGALLNKPTIVLFGPSNKKKFLHFNVNVVSSDCECSPCSRKEMLECKDNKCMKNITVSNVKLTLTEKIERLLK